MPKKAAKPTAAKQGAKQGPPEGRRWKPGQSGNPAGRKPNAQCLTACLREEVEKIPVGEKQGRTWTQLIVLATLRLAMQGNSTALKEVWERLDGKVTTPLDLDPNGTGQPLIRVQMVPAKGEE